MNAPYGVIARQISPVNVYFEGAGCHVLCLYTVTGLVCSVYCDGAGCHVPCLYMVGCHVLWLYTVTGWDVMSCGCIQ